MDKNINYLEINLGKIGTTFMKKIIKFYLNTFKKTWINKETNHIHELEESFSLSYYLSPNYISNQIWT